MIDIILFVLFLAGVITIGLSIRKINRRITHINKCLRIFGVPKVERSNGKK